MSRSPSTAGWRGRAASAVVQRAGRPRARRHDAVHPRPDAVRRGHRADPRCSKGVTFVLLRRNRGAILPTVIAVTAVVAVASGILGGVSMIGLTIRTLVIILMLAAAPMAAIRYADHGLHRRHDDLRRLLAYGEPPNLIMKANLDPRPRRTRSFSPTARRWRSSAISVVALAARQTAARASGSTSTTMDVLDANAEDVRFLQATRHGEVLTPVELVEGHAAILGGRAGSVIGADRSTASRSASRWSGRRCPARSGELLLGHYVSEELAAALDRHYVLEAPGDDEGACARSRAVDEVLRRCSASGGAAPSASARWRSSRSSRCWCCTASTTTCRCFWRRSPASPWRCRRLPTFRRCARSPCGRRGTNTRSTTSCSRCSSRSRC